MLKRNQADLMVRGGAAVIVAVAGAAKAQDFDGLYGGLSYTKGSGDFVDNNDPYSFDGSAMGGFVGYNHVMGDWLFGAELAFSNGDYESFYPSSFPYLDVEDVRELKARVGRVFGKTLVYGVVGKSDFHLDVANGAPGSADASASAFGLGFETAIGAKTFVGAEYLRRDIDGNDVPNGYADNGAELNTLSLRMGLRF